MFPNVMVELIFELFELFDKATKFGVKLDDGWFCFEDDAKSY